MDLEIPQKDAYQSVKQWAYTLLKDNIIRLHLKPGTAVSEAEIADILHTSRTPVREAFISLAEDGLLEIFPQRGSFVSLIDIDQAEEACFVRKVLGKAVLKEACKTFPEDCVLSLSANLEMQKFCQQENNYEKLFQLDNDFHRIIYHGCGKERIWLHIKKMNYNFDRLRVLRLSKGIAWEKVVHQHEQIVRVILEKDCLQVDRIMDEHLSKAFVDECETQHSGYFKQENRRNST